MGTYYEWVVDLDATEADAPALGQRVVDTLVARGVLLPHLSPDAALGADGYPAGPEWAWSMERSASQERPWGMEVRVGRALHDGGQGGVDSVTCPLCSTRRGFYGPPEEFGPTCTDEDGLDWFHEAVATWSAGDAADLECRTCGGAAPVTDWSVEGAALACLGFNFWGWGELRPEMIRVIAEATGGHRTANGSGKV